MSIQPKPRPNASNGQNYINIASYRGKHLLSTFREGGNNNDNNNNNDNGNNKDINNKDTNGKAAKENAKTVPEPDIYDQPRSSSDEDDESEANLSDDDDLGLGGVSKKRDRPVGKTLDEKMADTDGVNGTENEVAGEREEEEEKEVEVVKEVKQEKKNKNKKTKTKADTGPDATPTRRSGRKGKINSSNIREESTSPKPQKRAFTESFGGDDDGEDMWFLSSQNTRRTTNRYSRNNTFQKSRKSSSATPSGSMPSSQQGKKRTGGKGKDKEKKMDDDDDDDDEDAGGGFKVPMEIHIPSPPPSKKRKSPAPARRDDETWPDTSQFKFPPAWPNDTVSSSSNTATSSRNPQVFDVDADDDDDNNSLSSALSSPLSPVPDFPLELTEAEKKHIESEELNTDPNEPLCPVCNQRVDPDSLRAFMSKPRRRVREQRQFCESHKLASAEVEWKEKSYPAIDWDTFDDRICRHLPEIEKLLVPEASSFYRNILDTAMKSGQAKNFRLTLSGDGLENISCGYYGSRGAGKMYFYFFFSFSLTPCYYYWRLITIFLRLHIVSSRFSRHLRRLAAFDHIVKTAGVAGYAQSVLVPELAMRLVKEDMGVSDESARKIMRESITIGEKMNPALNDVVHVPEDQKIENWD